MDFEDKLQKRNETLPFHLFSLRVFLSAFGLGSRPSTVILPSKEKCIFLLFAYFSQQAIHTHTFIENSFPFAYSNHLTLAFEFFAHRWFGRSLEPFTLL